MAVVAYTFHFPASELWAMDIEELLDWHAQAKAINKKLET
jgi:hypothetical protein